MGDLSVAWKGPVTAYHLDTTNPARLSIAARVELRPNDIVFAATKPIYEANEICLN